MRQLTLIEKDDLGWAFQRYRETVTAANDKPLSEARRMDRLQTLVELLQRDGLIGTDRHDGDVRP